MLTFWRPPRLPRYTALLALAAAAQAASMLGLHLTWLFAFSAVAISWWCFYNLKIAGVLCITIGAGMNMLVMALHGGAMPVHASTLAALGQHVAPGTLLIASKDVVIQSSPLGLLADWLVIHLGSKVIIASPGDLLVLIGVLCWLLASPSQRKDFSYAPSHAWFSARARHVCPPGAK
jgi:hypothetical protein